MYKEYVHDDGSTAVLEADKNTLAHADSDDSPVVHTITEGSSMGDFSSLEQAVEWIRTFGFYDAAEAAFEARMRELDALEG